MILNQKPLPGSPSWCHIYQINLLRIALKRIFARRSTFFWEARCNRRKPLLMVRNYGKPLKPVDLRNFWLEPAKLATGVAGHGQLVKKRCSTFFLIQTVTIFSFLSLICFQANLKFPLYTTDLFIHRRSKSWRQNI